MNVVTELTLEALKQHQLGSLERYRPFLRATFEAQPPPFTTDWYGDRFREMARDPEWFANVIVGNASTEGWGASKLWYLAGKTRQEDISELVQQHARDEARHSRIYSRMVGLVFPQTRTEELQAQLKILAPTFRIEDRPEVLPAYSRQEVLDNLLQMNVAEIRTMVNQLLARPVILTYCPEASRAQVTRMLDRLMWDETRHVGYTGWLMDAALGAEDSEFLQDIASLRMTQFNELTLSEVGNAPTNPTGSFS